jgi:molybdopterin-guanine dinucleotide biosynthesis protein B
MSLWIAISGGKNVGKTSVIEQIIRHLKSLGYSVATVKHTHLSIEPDASGTDTYRHRHAGAETTVLAGPEGYFLHKAASGETLLPHSLIELLSESDVVLCEGFYHSDMPKVVIESETADEKTSSEPKEPVILKTRIQRDQDGAAVLSTDDLHRVISYIQARQKPGGTTSSADSET